MLARERKKIKKTSNMSKKILVRIDDSLRTQAIFENVQKMNIALRLGV